MWYCGGDGAPQKINISLFLRKQAEFAIIAAESGILMDIEYPAEVRLSPLCGGEQTKRPE